MTDPTDDVHPAARAAVDPHLYRTDAEYHATADMLTPILRAVEEALETGGHLGPRRVLERVARNLLPTADEVARRQREHRERVRLASEQVRTAFDLPPEIAIEWEDPEPVDLGAEWHPLERRHPRTAGTAPTRPFGASPGQDAP